MSRLLNILVIISLLVTQSAWAIEGSALDADSNKDSTGQNWSSPADQHDDLSDNCNHFCHASGHLVGLFSSITVVLLATSDRHEPAYDNLVNSLTYQPPVPPPIS
jgi:hypothetical protein